MAGSVHVECRDVNGGGGRRAEYVGEKSLPQTDGALGTAEGGELQRGVFVYLQKQIAGRRWERSLGWGETKNIIAGGILNFKKAGWCKHPCFCFGFNLAQNDTRDVVMDTVEESGWTIF